MRRLAALGAVVVVLVVAGRGPLAPPASVGEAPAWLDDRGAVVAAMALLRVAALAVALWLVTVSVLAALARGAGAVRLAAGAERALPARLRAASVVAAAAAVAAAPVSAQERDGTATMSVVVDDVPTTTTETTTTTTAPAPPPAPAPVAPPTPPPAEWVVGVGDSFWSIAEEVVADALGRLPTDAEVTPYWYALVEANRDRLVSANPDLVLPGQAFVVPPLSAAP